jgi:hypothetical protein
LKAWLRYEVSVNENALDGMRNKTKPRPRESTERALKLYYQKVADKIEPARALKEAALEAKCDERTLRRHRAPPPRPSKV